jgi:hypothetical protein
MLHKFVHRIGRLLSIHVNSTNDSLEQSSIRLLVQEGVIGIMLAALPESYPPAHSCKIGIGETSITPFFLPSSCFLSVC